MEVKRGKEFIDLDSFANIAAGRRKQKKYRETIDVASYGIRDVIDVDSYAERVIIDVDLSTNDTALRAKTKRDIVDVDSYPDVLINGHAALSNRHDKNDEEVIIIRETKKAKLVTKKSSATPDESVPDYIKNNYYVVEVGNEIYDAMLTQTIVEDNINKLYVIQVLEANDGGSFMVYHKWGKIGAKGKIKLSGPHFSPYSATQEFEEKFYEKTNNHWSNKKNFVPYPNCHTWLEIDYSKKDQGEPSASRFAKRILDPRVARFISLICNMNMMTQQMTAIGYDAAKLPLKNLSKSTILKGYDVLKLIADVMGQSNRKLLEELSGEFYSIIPHDFGYKKLCEFVIDTPQKLRSKMEMVEELGEIENATTLLANWKGMQEDPLYARYEQLHCNLAPVEADSEDFSMIEKYLRNTNNGGFSVDIVQIFRVSREGEIMQFRKYAHIENRMLLWHGSPLTNWIGILSQGLHPKRSRCGGGTFFADMFAKSVAYCRSCSSAVLTLCEVALGEMQGHGRHPLGNIRSKSAYYTKIIGTTTPAESKVLEDGVVVPLGKPLNNAYSGVYNEYIVYKKDQIKMRYVIEVRFNNGQQT